MLEVGGVREDGPTIHQIIMFPLPQCVELFLGSSCLVRENISQLLAFRYWSCDWFSPIDYVKDLMCVTARLGY